MTGQKAPPNDEGKYRGERGARLSRLIGMREWSRCGGRARYDVDVAVEQRRLARAGGANNARVYDEAAWAEVHAWLQEHWSPDSIAGRRLALPAEGAQALPCRSRIYVWAHAQDAPWWKDKCQQRFETDTVFSQSAK